MNFEISLTQEWAFGQGCCEVPFTSYLGHVSFILFYFIFVKHAMQKGNKCQLLLSGDEL